MALQPDPPPVALDDGLFLENLAENMQHESEDADSERDGLASCPGYSGAPSPESVQVPAIVNISEHLVTPTLPSHPTFPSHPYPPGQPILPSHHVSPELVSKEFWRTEGVYGTIFTKFGEQRAASKPGSYSSLATVALTRKNTRRPSTHKSLGQLAAENASSAEIEKKRKEACLKRLRSHFRRKSRHENSFEIERNIPSVPEIPLTVSAKDTLPHHTFRDLSRAPTLLQAVDVRPATSPQQSSRLPVPQEIKSQPRPSTTEIIETAESNPKAPTRPPPALPVELPANEPVFRVTGPLSPSSSRSSSRSLSRWTTAYQELHNGDTPRVNQSLELLQPPHIPNERQAMGVSPCFMGTPSVSERGSGSLLRSGRSRSAHSRGRGFPIDLH